VLILAFVSSWVSEKSNRKWTIFEHWGNEERTKNEKCRRSRYCPFFADIV